MAMNVGVQATNTGGPVGDSPLNFSASIDAPVQCDLPVAVVAAGTVPIGVPAGATMMSIIPPALGAAALTLKFFTPNDPGLPLSRDRPFGPWHFDRTAPPTIVYLTFAAAGSVVVSFR